MLHLLLHGNWVYSRPYLFNLRNFDLFEILRDVFACFFFLLLFDELKHLDAFRVLTGGFLTLTISSGRVLKMTALILGTCIIVTPVPIKATHSLPLNGSHPKFVFGWFKQSYLFVLNEFWTRRDFFDLAVKSATLYDIRAWPVTTNVRYYIRNHCATTHWSKSVYLLVLRNSWSNSKSTETQ